MKTIDIKNIDYETTCFHYTNGKNLDSIFKNGLIPKIGKNSKSIELTKKIFFTIGFDNTLILMDSWIKWLTLRPKSNFIYMCGSFYMKHKIFPRIVVDKLFQKWSKNDKRILKACQKLDLILQDSIYLKLDLEENIDFSFEDIDEVKKQSFSRKQLSYIYTYGYDLNNPRLELWNMHTISDKIIEKEKLSLLECDGSTSAKDIILFMVKNTKLNVKESCPFFYRYLEFIKYNKEW